MPTNHCACGTIISPKAEQCRVCYRATLRKYDTEDDRRVAHIARKRVRRAERRLENPDAVKAEARRDYLNWKGETPEELAAFRAYNLKKSKKRAVDHPDEVAASQKQVREQNKLLEGLSEEEKAEARLVAHNARMQKWRTENYEPWCEIQSKAHLKFRTKNREEIREGQRASRQRARLAIVEFFGGKCMKCGFEEDKRLLQLDHINGDGWKERHSNGWRSTDVYKRLKQILADPELARQTFQLLCANCNLQKKYDNKEFGA